MKRIILHWTGGTHTPNSLDLEHYHFIVDGAGKVHTGKFPVSANEAPVAGRYAAHTLNCNTGSIGVSLAAMAGAVERPFNRGNYPITDPQLEAAVALCGKLAKEYSIPVTRQTILSHAEVQPTLGIQQRGKWDIAWVPGLTAPTDPIKIGDQIRAKIAASMTAKPPYVEPVAPAPTPTTNPLIAIMALLRSIFGGKK